MHSYQDFAPSAGPKSCSPSRASASSALPSAFAGFSTFNARPLLNLHHLTVRPEEQRQGLGRALLEAVEQRARELRCCKLTLEAHEDNSRARNLYAAFGFDRHHVGEGTKATFFFEKRL
jgi:GNAT superfamily N-acetyltransferase